MPTTSGSTDAEDDGAPKMTLWERIKYSMVRPDDEPARGKQEETRSLEEIELEISRSSDKEQAIGLVAAPIAAIVGIIIGSASISYAKSHNQNVHVYDELTYVLLGLAILVLVSSLLRKRLFQGITLALFGLAIFQLHYTYIGFAVPFLLAGAWYMVRAYRLQQALKHVQGDTRGVLSPERKNGAPAKNPRPRRNKRYTPPT
jgi:hypothetical protein